MLALSLIKSSSFSSENVWSFKSAIMSLKKDKPMPNADTRPTTINALPLPLTAKNAMPEHKIEA